MELTQITLAFDGGTITIEGGSPDMREYLRQYRIAYADKARAYEPVAWQLSSDREPFPHQTEGLDTWWKARGEGVVVLPTGTGKTFLAMMAIEKAGRPAIVVTPTIDLITQWHTQLEAGFGTKVGLLGGGSYDIQLLTVSTYDSAYLYVERWGNKFGLLVCDECHHLPGPSYQMIAAGSIAPFRLGLTATPERADGQDAALPALLGPIVYRREITQLAGEFLAEYRT